MNNTSHIFTYVIKKISKHPMYGSSIIIKDCGIDKQAAIQFLQEYNPQNDSNDLLVLEEREYVNKEQFEKQLTLYQRPIWSAAFHGYDNLPSTDKR